MWVDGGRLRSRQLTDRRSGCVPRLDRQVATGGGDREWTCQAAVSRVRERPSLTGTRHFDSRRIVDDQIPTIPRSRARSRVDRGSVQRWRWSRLPCGVGTGRQRRRQWRARHQWLSGHAQRAVPVGRQRGGGLQGRPGGLHREDRLGRQLRGRPPDVLDDPAVAHHRRQPAGHRDHPGHRLPAPLRQGWLAQEDRRPWRRHLDADRRLPRGLPRRRHGRRRAVRAAGEVQQQGHDVVPAGRLQGGQRHRTDDMGRVQGGAREPEGQARAPWHSVPRTTGT